MKEDCGTVEFKGIAYRLTAQCDYSNRLLPFNNYHEVDDGEEYNFEVSSAAEYDDEEGNTVTGTIYWIFTGIKGELDHDMDFYDYDDVNRFEQD